MFKNNEKGIKIGKERETCEMTESKTNQLGTEKYEKRGNSWQ
jgi:hypothetical protein